MKSRILLIATLVLIFGVSLVYADCAVGTTGWVIATYGGRSVRDCSRTASGTASITENWGTFSDIYVSRDDGRTWETVFENDSKQIQWAVPTTLSSVNIPAGRYTKAKDKESDEWLVLNVKLDACDSTKTITHHLAADTDFIIDPCDVTVERDGTATLTLDSPIVQSALLIRWDGSTYVVDDSDCGMDKQEYDGGSRFAQ